MGSTQAKPSHYLEKQWIKDTDTNRCYSCCKVFSATRRRHHCRCCGEVYCSSCWGKLLTLPPEYGYEGKVPVCHFCEEFFSGKMKYLRMPRRIVLTRSAKITKQTEVPPLCQKNVDTKNFEVFFMKLGHWRPISARTHLQFSITLRTANGRNSSVFNKFTIETGGVILPKPAPGFIPVPSDLDLDVRAKITAGQADGGSFAAVNGKLSGGSKGTPVSAGAAPNNNNSSNSGSSTPKEPRRIDPGIQALINSEKGGVGVAPSSSSSSRRSGEQYQLDVAWTISLESLIQVVLDHHEESDYITLETAQEILRIQVADIEGPITQEQEAFLVQEQREKLRITQEKQQNEQQEHEQQDERETVEGSGDVPPPSSTVEGTDPPKKKKKGVKIAFAAGPVVAAEPAGVSPSPPSLKRDSPTMRNNTSGSPRQSNNVVTTNNSSSSSSADAVLTSKPVRGARFVVDAESTNMLFLELQEAIRLMNNRTNQQHLETSSVSSSKR